jgi:ribonuclease G
VALRVLRDSQAAEIERIVVDDEVLHARLLSWLRAHAPQAAGRLVLHAGATGLFESLGLEQEIDKALRDRAWLKSGGYLVINQLEALVAVDVNTGKFTGGKRLEDTVLQVNLEAAREVARQLRLRDLGGIVVVDFIDMTEAPHRQAVLRELETALSRDRARTTVLGMSEFGIVQLTRQRQKKSLDRVLLQACPDCHGSGRIKSAETLAHAVLRRVRRQPPGRLTVRLQPEIAGVVRRRLELLEQQGQALECRLTVIEDPSIAREAFEITTTG